MSTREPHSYHGLHVSEPGWDSHFCFLAAILEHWDCFSWLVWVIARFLVVVQNLRYRQDAASQTPWHPPFALYRYPERPGSPSSNRHRSSLDMSFTPCFNLGRNWMSFHEARILVEGIDISDSYKDLEASVGELPFENAFLSTETFRPRRFILYKAVPGWQISGDFIFFTLSGILPARYRVQDFFSHAVFVGQRSLTIRQRPRLKAGKSAYLVVLEEFPPHTSFLPITHFYGATSNPLLQALASATANNKATRLFTLR